MRGRLCVDYGVDALLEIFDLGFAYGAGGMVGLMRASW